MLPVTKIVIFLILLHFFSFFSNKKIVTIATFCLSNIYKIHYFYLPKNCVLWKKKCNFADSLINLIIMRQIITIVALAMLATGAMAQKSVVATGGSASSIEHVTISYSVGQIAIGAAQATNFSVNEGVQQPIAVSELSIEEALLLAVELKVYPNPSSQTLYIDRAEAEKELQYQIISSDGAEKLSGTLTGNTTAVSLQSLPAAIYLLRVTDGKQQRAYRIIKK